MDGDDKGRRIASAVGPHRSHGPLRGRPRGFRQGM
jgi:hypothetical protein